MKNFQAFKGSVNFDKKYLVDIGASAMMTALVVGVDAVALSTYDFDVVGPLAVANIILIGGAMLGPGVYRLGQEDETRKGAKQKVLTESLELDDWTKNAFITNDYIIK